MFDAQIVQIEDELAIVRAALRRGASSRQQTTPGPTACPGSWTQPAGTRNENAAIAANASVAPKGQAIRISVGENRTVTDCSAYEYTCSTAL